MKYRTPRCIAITGTQRCHRPAALKRFGDLFICTKHNFWLMVFIDMLAAPTRQMLAFTHWQTAREGQELIDRMHGRRAA
jgi:hypothetical protein